MLHTKDQSDISEDDLIVVLVGLTAGWRKRRQARSYFNKCFGARVYLPWIPYAFGLGASAAWLSFRLHNEITKGSYRRIHFIAYIGGGVLLRLLHARGERWPIGRGVWDRGPIQEQVAAALTERVPSIILTLAGLRSVVDLARLDTSKLAFPQCPLGAGLILETESSALARRLGIRATSLALSPDDVQALLPGASAAIALPVSHDDVYEDPKFLDAAAAFLRTGAFSGPGTEPTS